MRDMHLPPTFHSCPHCGRGIPLDQRTTRCRGCGGDLTPVLRQQQARNVGCLTNFGFGMAGALTGGLISLTALFFLRPRPLWKLDERDLAAMVVFSAGGALLGAIIGTVIGLWLPFDQRARFETVLIFLAGATAAVLTLLLAGCSPKRALAAGAPAGLAVGLVFWLAVERQRERDLAELRMQAAEESTDNRPPDE